MAYVTFAGPEAGVVYQKDPSGKRIPRFAVDKTSSKTQTIQRILPDGSRTQFATSTASKILGSTQISIKGAQITMEASWEGMQYGVDVKNTPMGDLKWSPSSSFGHEVRLKDARGTTVAEYKTKSRSGRELTLQVFVPVDDALVDTIVACAVSLNGKLA